MALEARQLRDEYPDKGSLQSHPGRNFVEITVQGSMFLAAALAIGVTVGILWSIGIEAIQFFQRVPLQDFLFDTVWTPLFATKRFGIWALVSATILTSLIALAVAVPLGLISAIYLSEFAPGRVRDVVKPILEILAGIPTVVFGYFALTVVTPTLRDLIFGDSLSTFNALSAGLVMGVMIIPLVASLSEDALSAVPQSMREGAMGLGATRFETAVRVVLPAGLSGVVAACILAASRAVGETMIVAIAGGQNPRFTFNPLETSQTMTSYIVQVSLGDTPFGSIEYFTIFAVGFTLFVVTFSMNVFSFWFVRRFREEYE